MRLVADAIWVKEREDRGEVTDGPRSARVSMAETGRRCEAHRCIDAEERDADEVLIDDERPTTVLRGVCVTNDPARWGGGWGGGVWWQVIERRMAVTLSVPAASSPRGTVWPHSH